MSERLKAALRRRSVDLARRPVPRADRDRQPRRPGQGQVGRRRHHQPDDLRRRDLRRRAVRRPGPPPRRPTAPTSTRSSSSSPPSDVRAACDVLQPTYDATGGVDGRVSIEVAPDLGVRHRGDPRVRPGAVGRGRPRQPLHQDPGHHRGRARDHRRPRRRDQRQRHPDLRPRPLRRGDGRLPRRAWSRRSTQRQRPVQDPLGGVVLRLPRRHRDRQAARRQIGTDEALALRGKAGVANARLAYRDYQQFFAGDRWASARRGRRQHPAPAVGVHRREEPRLLRHHVRRRPRRRQHRQHDAGEDPGGLRRPRRGRRRPGHRDVRRRPAGDGRPGRPSASTTTT